MIPTASSLYMRAPVPYNVAGQSYYPGVSYSAVSPQSYYVQSPSSYQVPMQQPRIQLPPAQSAQHPLTIPVSQSTQPQVSRSAVMQDDTPVATRRFNAYKENRENMAYSMMNTSSQSLRPHASTGMLPSDFGEILKQAVTEAVKAERQTFGGSVSPSGGIDIHQVEQALLREREERKAIKTQLKHEKKQVEILGEKIKASEKTKIELEEARLEQKRLERENVNQGKEIEILQNEVSELRNERILAEQLDEEHSAKMKVYTQDLMVTSVKYQQDIQSLIGKNEKLIKENEVLKAKCAELERQNTHNEQVQESLNRKLASKDAEIASANKELKKSVGLQGAAASVVTEGSENKAKTAEFQNKIKELESIIASQKSQIAASANQARQSSGVAAAAAADDVFGILRSAKSLTPAKRVSHLSSRKDRDSFEPAVVNNDYSEWLEPLAIAEHVLNGATPGVR